MKVKGLGKPKDKIQIFEETVREARKYLPEQDVQDLLRHATAEDIEHTTSLLKAMTTATKALKKAEKSLGYVIQDHEEPEESKFVAVKLHTSFSDS